MSDANTNNKVAKELSDAMARCKQQGIDEQTLRTGLLTITIANFVNRIGMDNTVALFQALPEQISSGIFNRYIDPNTNTARSYASPAPAYQQPASQYQQPQQPQQTGFAPGPVTVSPTTMHTNNPNFPQPEPVPNPYQNPSLPQSFVPPFGGQAYGQASSQSAGQELHGRRKLPD